MDDLRDRDIRHALLEELRGRYAGLDVCIVPELDLRGATRVDIAVVGPRWLHGWEIKSDRDTLRRLPHQVEIYGRVLNQASIVLTERHKREGKRIVPQWWGLEIASIGPEGQVKIAGVRECRRNRHIDQLMLAGLLWKTETISLMRERGTSAGSRRGSIREIQKRMLAEMPFYIIHARVCRQLRERQGGLRGIV